MERKEKTVIVDTNVLISSLINPESAVWDLLDLPDVSFLVPEIALDELEKYEDMVEDSLEEREREEAYEYLISKLFDSVTVVPVRIYREELPAAYQVMEDIDEKDTEFLALALALEAPILSDDSDFQQQDEIEVYSSEDAVGELL
ncbi:MAG: PIN domain-containing protein [Candidatus Nanohaloarchaea archaeon]|nr:PIN domain-containing protein [Candidatus Nanohaloarchaea archaeon]